MGWKDVLTKRPQVYSIISAKPIQSAGEAGVFNRSCFLFALHEGYRDTQSVKDQFRTSMKITIIKQIAFLASPRLQISKG
jgi:hypothetical protein